MNTIKIELKADMAEALVLLFGEYLNMNYTEADDKLVMAVLADLRISLMKKLLNPKPKYKITLEAAAAIALQIFYDDFIDEYTTSVGNKLHQISNQVKKTF